MARYELSNAAAIDFQRIFEFGIDTFGFSQALKYQQGLKSRLSELAGQPMLSRLLTIFEKAIGVASTNRTQFTTFVVKSMS